jgi:polyphosphate kinase 2 (PPK2 family)
MAPLFSITRKRKLPCFNRTHYENVLVTRVHPEYILNENLPGLEDVSLIRCLLKEDIRNFEKHITENGTIVLKFFYISVRRSRENVY